MEKLAIYGGPKVRTEPFPERAPFGEREEELLLQAVRSQTLFVKSGTFVKELEKEFAARFTAHSTHKHRQAEPLPSTQRSVSSIPTPATKSSPRQSPIPAALCQFSCRTPSLSLPM